MSSLKNVFINGASRGIGAEIVRLLTTSGYSVAFSYKSSSGQAEALAAETGALAICADTASAEDVRRALTVARRTLGSIDVLINNAAISVIKLYTDVSEAEWQTMLDVNLNGPMRYIKEVLPDMISAKSGKIVNISSMWGLVGASCEVHYSTTKAALIGLTRSLAKELGPSGITVNAIAPGVIKTEMNASLSEEALEELRMQTPLMRLGKPLDVAKAVLYLLSDAGDFVTGQVLSVDGGIVM